MRKWLLSCVALSLFVPAAASAEGGCPDKLTADLLSSFGEPVGFLDPGQTVHQLTDVTMLGLPSNYVVVNRTPGKDTVEELDYRLGAVMRKYSERYPLDVRKAFDKVYPGSRCGNDKVMSCSIAFQSAAATSGQLAAVQLGEGAVEVPDDAHGDGISLVKNDYASDDSGPLFLVCLYDTSG